MSLCLDSLRAGASCASPGPLSEARSLRGRRSGWVPSRLRAVGAAMVGLIGAAAVAVSPAAATPSGLGLYSVASIETAGYASGDVVVVGDALFVGRGAFGGQSQSVVRIDAGGETVVATGFNSLAGFAYDAVNDRLIVGDNALEASGSATGDSVYAIPDPFSDPVTPPPATSLAILPAGAVPGISDVVLDPRDPGGDTLLVGDASSSFPPAGEVLSVAVSTAATASVATGFAFTAGLAVDGRTLYVGESALDFSGNVWAVDLDAPAAATPVASLPDGEFDLEMGPDGFLYATTGGRIVRIDPGDGTVTSVASGFGFAAGLFAADDGRLFAVDGFAAPGEENRVWVFTPIPEPGGAALLGLAVAAVLARRRRA